MNNYINKYMRNLRPYKVASHKIWNVEPEHRENILKLDWNESSQQPSPLVEEAVKELMTNPNFFNLYPAAYNEKLMKALSSYANMPEENIQYFSGSDSLHEYISRLYISPGDPVMILWPSYDNFRLTAEAEGARIYYSELDENFDFDINSFVQDMNKYNPSFVYICNPVNPSGTFIEPELITKIISDFHDTIFLIDEAYSEFAKKSVNNLALKHNNILVCHTMSKAFALANFRLGYLVASSENIECINKIRNSKNISTFAQIAAVAALSDTEYMKSYVDEVIKARSWFTAKINSLSGLHAYESRGNFVLIRCKDFEMKRRIISGLEDRNIFIRNLSQSSRLNECVRITIGTLKQMERVFKSIKELI